MKRILITGANSYIGTSFENYVKINYPNDYIIDTVDMIDGTWRDKNFSGYDSVFHVAGIAHQKETRENAELYYKVNCDLAVETAKKAKNEGVRQFVFLSSMSVYGMDTGVITKETIPNPKSNYGKSKLKAEKLIIALQSPVFSVAILRPPMVYGKNCKGNYNQLKKLSLCLPIFPRVNNERSMIYIVNLCQFVKKMIDLNFDGYFFPQNKEYVNTSQMAQLIARYNSKKIGLDPISGFGVNCLSKTIHMLAKAFGTLKYCGLDTDFDYCIFSLEDSIKDIYSEKD